MFYSKGLVTVQHDDITNSTVGCVVLLIMYFFRLILILRQTVTLLTLRMIF